MSAKPSGGHVGGATFRVPIAEIAATLATVALVLAELVGYVGLHMGGPCGGDGGSAYAVAGSSAARFCGHTPEHVWSMALLGALTIVPLAYAVTRASGSRWPLALGILVAGAAVGSLDNYALSLSTGAV